MKTMAFKSWWILLGSLLLAACGGGDSLNKDDDTTEPTPPDAELAISMSLVDEDGNTLTSVSQAEPGIIEAVLTVDGSALAGELISFETEATGVISPESGTAVTDADGIARVSLLPGDVTGGGRVFASYAGEQGSATGSISFTSAGDGGGSTLLSYTIATDIQDADGASIRNVSAATPGFVKATVLNDSAPVANALVTFTSSVGLINPTLGTALTDSSGVATVTLLPGTEAGAGAITATYELPESAQTSTVTTISSDYSFTTSGDGESTSGDNSFLLTLTLSNSTITEAEPGVASVTLLNASGQPVAQRVVTFTSTLGNITPASGTALTDSTGTAVVLLNAGSIQGAGEITASFEGSATTVGFYTEGDQINEDDLTVEITSVLYNCENNSIPPSSDCVESNNISTSQPGTLLVTVLQEGSSTVVADTLVNVTSTIGRLSPSNGAAITDENGQATVDILADTEVGAGQYTVTVQGKSQTKAFQVGAADIILSVSKRLSGNVPAGGSTVIDIQLFENDGITPYNETLQLELASACQVAGTAALDTPVVSINSIASSTYTAQGCKGTDRVEVTALTGGKTISESLDINIDAASIGAIQFIGVSEEFIAIQQAGGIERPTTSVVTFRLLDANDNAVAGQEIEFALSSGNGNVTIDPLSAFTDASGYARTTVTSGTVPTPVRVAATYSEAGVVVASNVSDKIIVSTGLADNNSFSLAVSNHNPEGLNLDGIEVTVTAYAADHFNNPVPDGTTVFFTTEGGAVEPSCQTANGSCFVTWRSQNPRPLASGDPRYPIAFDFKNTIVDAGCMNAWGAPGPCLNNEIRTVANAPLSGPQGARASILAFILGEESFLDSNNNGQFDDGEYFVPLGDAFVDHNENLGDTATVADAYNEDASAAFNAVDGLDLNGGELEEFFDNPIPEAADGIYTPPADIATARYQGTLCSDSARAAGHCTVPAVHARARNTIVMSGSDPYIRMGNGSGASFVDRSFLDLRENRNDSADIWISDIYNNPIPKGTIISVNARNVTLLSDSIYLYPDTTSITRIPVSVRRPDAPTGDGVVTLSFETPEGVITSYIIDVFVI